jgi:hypothetical protein
MKKIHIFIILISILSIGIILFSIFIALIVNRNKRISSNNEFPKTSAPKPEHPKTAEPKPTPPKPETLIPEHHKTKVPKPTDSPYYFPNEIGVVTLSKLPEVQDDCNSKDKIDKNCDYGVNCLSPSTPVTFWLGNMKYDNVIAKIHGSSTSTWEKKIYNIKFDKKTKLIDYIPSSKSYILYGPYYEFNKYQNALSYYLSNSMNFPAPKCYPVFLWINENGPEKTAQDWINYNDKTTLTAQSCNGKTISGGDKPFRGLYWVLNKIDEHLIDLKETDYLIEFDRGLCCKDVKGLIDFAPFGFNMKYECKNLGWSRPIIEFAGKNVKEDVGILLKNFAEKLFSNTDEPSDEALNMIDFESWAKYFILTELFNSVDSYFYSSNMSIRYDKSSSVYKIFMGPVWDYNQAFCNCSGYYYCRDGGNPKFWKYTKQWFTFKNPNSQVRYCLPEFYARILMSKKFRTYVIDMFRKLRKNELETKEILSLCTKFESLLKEAVNSDLQRWSNYFGHPINSDKNSPPNQKTYYDTINWWFEYLRKCISTRLEWLDKNMVDNFDNSKIDPKNGTNYASLGLNFEQNIPEASKNNLYKKCVNNKCEGGNTCNNGYCVYNGSCVINNQFSECDVQKNDGFFYAKYPSFIPNVYCTGNSCK